MPWTNNASEQALKGPKRHQAVSGYWHTLTTLAHYCRARSYLVTTRNYNVRPIDAIHNALTGNLANCPMHINGSTAMGVDELRVVWRL